jgi:Ca2+-binding EF-hand superfamily protein
MAAVAGGVQVQDVCLASSFTQGDLRYLKSQFDIISSGKPGNVTATDLVSGMKALNIEGSFTSEEIEGIISQCHSQRPGCLDFEDFLRVLLIFPNHFATYICMYLGSCFLILFCLMLN